MPYRLQRGGENLSLNPFVRGWNHGRQHFFWGQCDEEVPAGAVRRSAQYRWEPTGCTSMLTDFTVGKFCSLNAIHGRDLILVGDSLTGQLFISLLALLKGTFIKEHQPPPSQIRKLSRWSFAEDGLAHELQVDAVACVEKAPLWQHNRDGTQPVSYPPLPVSFFRNDYLSNNTVAKVSNTHAHAFPWVRNVTERSIVLLQVGAWFAAAPNPFASFAHALDQTFDTIRRRIGHKAWAKQVVLFSSSMPIPGCQKFLSWPLNQSMNMTRFKKLHEVNRYGWDHFETLNSIGEQMALQAGANFIDIAAPLSLRPDGHMPADCLHWCLPSAYDIGPQLLLNALMGRIGQPIGKLSSNL